MAKVRMAILGCGGMAGAHAQRFNTTNGIIQSELMEAIYESARTGLPAKPKRRK